MPKKNKNEVKKKSSSKPTNAFDAFDAILAGIRAATPDPLDPRKALLAQVAGTIAAGLVTTPSPSIASPSGMATAAVDIAEEILKKAGIPATASTESSETASAEAAS